KTEEMDIWLHKFHSVQLEFIREFVYFTGLNIFKRTVSVTFVKSHLYRVGESLQEMLILFIHKSVYHKMDFHSFFRSKSKAFKIFNACHIAVHLQPGKTSDLKGV